MPLELSRGDRKVLLIAAAVLVLLIAASLILTSGAEDTSDVPSTYSAGSHGAKAAYMLLESAGYRTARWEQAPAELTNPAGSTLILAEPEAFAAAGEQAAIRRFIEAGGRVVATGTFGASFLPGPAAIPDPTEGMTWKRVPSRSPSFITRAAPDITIAPQAYWLAPDATPLYGDDKELVVTYGAGSGDVIWWAAATPLSNAGLQEPGNLEFLLACAGVSDNRRILWDEYFHGHRRSTAVSAAMGPLRWLCLQIAVLALAALFTYSRRSGPIVLPGSERRLSPLEFVRTLGALYERAGATSVAVDISFRRFRYWLTRRLGMAGNASIDELDRAVRERWSHVDPAFAATLRDCESACADSELTARTALRLNRSLHEYADRLELFGIPRKESE
jgi:hypothetical protein